jgi:hypothetical protein
MFQVEWLQSALDELAAIWVRADSALRQAITAAAHSIEQELRRSPHQLGESREGEERVFFTYPLGVQFDIDDAQGTVRVLHVWDIRRRK